MAVFEDLYHPDAQGVLNGDKGDSEELPSFGVRVSDPALYTHSSGKYSSLPLSVHIRFDGLV